MPSRRLLAALLSLAPLILVAPPNRIVPAVPMPPDRAALPTIVEAMQMRLVSAGHLNAVVPQTIQTINAKPGKANPFGNMRPGERAKLLFASFSADQWNLAGGPSGIGAGDLTEDQQAIWGTLVPQAGELHKYTSHPGTESGTWRYDRPQIIPIKDMSAARLHINKQVTFDLFRNGQTEIGYGTDPYMYARHDNDVSYSLLSKQTDSETGQTFMNSTVSQSASDKHDSAYGIKLIVRVPNTLKPGQLDFAGIALDKPISLIWEPKPVKPIQSPNGQEFPGDPRGALPTVGEVLDRISKTTAYDFRCDRRIRDLPVWIRGDQARSGDVLMALAWGVGGAFRKLDTVKPQESLPKSGDRPIWLLAEDVEGIGSRVGRLINWAEEADILRRRVMDQSQEKARQNDPISRISYAPGDRYNPGKEMVKKTEDTFRSAQYEEPPDVKVSDLSPALRESVRKAVQEAAENDPPFYLQSDHLRLGEKLAATLTIPEANGTAIPLMQITDDLTQNYVQDLAYNPARKTVPPTAAAKPNAPKKPLGFPAQTTRRLLIARPADGAEAAALARSAAARGVTDLWFEIGVGEDPAAVQAMIQPAVKASAGTKMMVGLSVRLLRGSNLIGTTPSVNILGETGEEFSASTVRRWYPKTDDPGAVALAQRMEGNQGWAIPAGKASTAEIVRRVSALAAIPGVSELAFRRGTPPGFAGKLESGDGLWNNGDFGYTLGERRAFLNDRGIDPIDITEYAWPLQGVEWKIGYFPDSDGQGEYVEVNNRFVKRPADEIPRLSWWAWRKQANDTFLSDLYQAARNVRPTLPIYSDNRFSGYTHANMDWFGSWDSSKAPGIGEMFGTDTSTQESARKLSKQIFAHWGWWWTHDSATRPAAPADFARRITDAAYRFPYPAWDGFVMDMTDMPGADLLKLLDAFPTTKPTPKTRK